CRSRRSPISERLARWTDRRPDERRYAAGCRTQARPPAKERPGGNRGLSCKSRCCGAGGRQADAGRGPGSAGLGLQPCHGSFDLLPQRSDDLLLGPFPFTYGAKLVAGQRVEALQLDLGELVYRNNVLRALQLVGLRGLPVVAALGRLQMGRPGV